MKRLFKRFRPLQFRVISQEVVPGLYRIDGIFLHHFSEDLSESYLLLPRLVSVLEKSSDLNKKCIMYQRKVDVDKLNAVKVVIS